MGLTRCPLRDMTQLTIYVVWVIQREKVIRKKILFVRETRLRKVKFLVGFLFQGLKSSFPATADSIHSLTLLETSSSWSHIRLTRHLVMGIITDFLYTRLTFLSGTLWVVVLHTTGLKWLAANNNGTHQHVLSSSL